MCMCAPHQIWMTAHPTWRMPIQLDHMAFDVVMASNSSKRVGCLAILRRSQREKDQNDAIE